MRIARCSARASCSTSPKPRRPRRSGSRAARSNHAPRARSGGFARRSPPTGDPHDRPAAARRSTTMRLELALRDARHGAWTGRRPRRRTAGISRPASGPASRTPAARRATDARRSGWRPAAPARRPRAARAAGTGRRRRRRRAWASRAAHHPRGPAGPAPPPPVPARRARPRRPALAGAASASARQVALASARPAAAVHGPPARPIRPRAARCGLYRQRPGPTRSRSCGPRAGLPATREPGIGLVLMSFDGTLETVYEKLVERGTVLSRHVGADAGYWVSRRPALLLLHRRRSPGIVDDRRRWVGDALVWTDGTTTYRIESAPRERCDPHRGVAASRALTRDSQPGLSPACPGRRDPTSPAPGGSWMTRTTTLLAAGRRPRVAIGGYLALRQRAAR